MSFSSPKPIQTQVASPVSPAPCVPGRGAAMGRDAYHLRWPVAAPRSRVTAGLCLLPAGGFLWSGPRGLPRTRGDNVLVCLTAGSAALRLPRGETAVEGLAFLPAGTAFALQPQADAAGMTLLLGRDVVERAALPFSSAVVLAALDLPDAMALKDDLRVLAMLAERDSGAMRPDTASCLEAVAKLVARLSALHGTTEKRAETPLFLDAATLEARFARRVPEQELLPQG